ncbi:P-loop containing nucleoside triphosphate hydrolase protein [Pseudomassariella vexata]|uniref:p-loop containing nucleoside triphosphate hydrolase protein n=1 Tax=Pseudomassariella vexata TaxID=1141098 RepID=A0A1Y2D9C6_9PEZI|nr:P-loop containing nucleoside triphosphate hydrolase protein [Pseudomassariella vexata]ORY55862.1 P-loop containing nucleoside triphosphate hydrolase protein [Pseudomassariella vexata]
MSANGELQREGTDYTGQVNDSDVEKSVLSGDHLLNTTVSSISWRDVAVMVKHKETGEPLRIVDNVEGIVEAGEMCALMGPSGCGKTTLLNVLAHRPTNAREVNGSVLINGSPVSRATIREMSCFVEQEDALIGSLTVEETLDFAACLSVSTRTLSAKDRISRVRGLIKAFGLQKQANTLIGTPIRKGVSGGQKRRVGVASQLIASPTILFLDEPTSGLDSTASWEVMSLLGAAAKQNNLIIIASIHQPSTSTFNLFDKVMLLSGGKTHFFGPVTAVEGHYHAVGHAIPQHTNVAEFMLELVNTDFVAYRGPAQKHIDYLQWAWGASSHRRHVQAAIAEAESQAHRVTDSRNRAPSGTKPSSLSTILTLLHRSFIKSYRDVIAYTIRIAMYLGLGVMIGTVWLRLKPEQSSIQPYINGLFFGSAFMSFMAVAYVPAFLEDRLQYVKEYHNGLYGATALVVSNFIIGIPYLYIPVLIALLFSVVSYFLVNFHPGFHAFSVYLMWLFLDLLAAESLVVFFSSLFPSFVVALALVALANGLWMSTSGFLVTPGVLNVFYKYAFHYWDYQKWVFEGMMVNEFSERVYACPVIAGQCACMYRTDLMDLCMIRGQGVLDQYGFEPGNMWRNVGIVLTIVAGYRIAAWIVLSLRR